MWFELIRQEARIGGGGLAIGCLPDILPVKTREGDDGVKCLSIKITVECCDVVMVVNGYGPKPQTQLKEK